jgi:hypothetical protein
MKLGFVLRLRKWKEMSYTPINEHRLKANAKIFLNEARRFKRFNVKNIYVPKDIYDSLLESISPSERNSCIDSIPFEGKILVRGKK